MILKYRVYLSLTIILTMSFILSCTSYLDSPLVVYKSPEFRPEHFKNSQIAVLPPATGNAAYENTALIVLEGLLEKDYKTFKLIHPEQTLKFIRENNLGDKLKKVYALYGDAEDNVLFASAIGKSLNAEYTLYSTLTNVVFTGERVIDTELMTRYNREYNAVEDITNIRARYFRRTSISGYIKIVRNDTNKVVWAVENFTHVLEKVSGYRSVPWDDAMLAAYGERYFERMPRFRDFPSISRALYRFYDKILSRW